MKGDAIIILLEGMSAIVRNDRPIHGCQNLVVTLLLGKKKGYGYGVIRWKCSERNSQENSNSQT